MKITIELSEAQERGLKFVCDRANTEKQNSLPEAERAVFVPETPGEYASRIFTLALDSYEAQRVAEFKAEKVRQFDSLSPEAQAAVLAQFGS